MKILIIENEKPAADKLSRLLKNIDKNIEIIGISETVEDSVNILQSVSKPDLILMDIQLDDGLCFEIFETIKVNIPIIFTTAFNNYMLEAFKVNSVDYLLKPIKEDELCFAIEKFKSIHYSSYKEEIFHQLLREINKEYKNRFLIKVGDHYKSITEKEIACFYILEKAVFINTNDDKNYSIDYSLDYLQNIINPAVFFRINRNCIINIDQIADILSYSSSRLKVKLKNSKSLYDLIVSKEKVKGFKKWIDK